VNAVLGWWSGGAGLVEGSWNVVGRCRKLVSCIKRLCFVVLCDELSCACFQDLRS
jgi:hypothetical protein